MNTKPEQGGKTHFCYVCAIAVSPKRMKGCAYSPRHTQTSHKPQLLVPVLLEEAEPRTCTPTCMLSAATRCFCLRAVHKLRNKPKFTKPHKEINVCSLLVYLHGAPPRKLTFCLFVFNLGKLNPESTTPCCFALATQILPLDASLGITGQRCANPLFSPRNFLCRLLLPA